VPTFDVHKHTIKIVIREFSKLKLNNGFLEIKIIRDVELVDTNLAAITSCLIDIDDKFVIPIKIKVEIRRIVDVSLLHYS